MEIFLLKKYQVESIGYTLFVFINLRWQESQCTLTLLIRFVGRDEVCLLRFMKIVDEFEYIGLCNLRFGKEMIEDEGMYERSDESEQEVDYLKRIISRWIRRKDYLFIRGDRIGSDSTEGKSV